VAQRTNNSSIRYYSFLTLPQLEAQDFYDVDHLNVRGANRFTQLLNSTLHGKNQRSVATTDLKSNGIAR
jgi:hypothetical protein